MVSRANADPDGFGWFLFCITYLRIGLMAGKSTTRGKTHTTFLRTGRHCKGTASHSDLRALVCTTVREAIHPKPFPIAAVATATNNISDTTTTTNNNNNNNIKHQWHTTL